MTGHLRPVQPGEMPAPITDADSATILAEAVEKLARLRTPYWLGDDAVTLHALASLIRQAQQTLPEVVASARDQDYTWADIAQLLGISQAAAARRYRGNP